MLSGVLAGVAGGLASVIPAPVRLAGLLVSLPVIVGYELAGRPLGLPQARRAVPQTVIARWRVEGPLQFGFEMGTGVRTFMPTALPHALLVTLVLAGAPGPGLVAGVGFGAGRALMPLVRSRHPDPRAFDTALLRRLRDIGRICAVGFALAGVVVLTPLAARAWS